MKPFTKVSQCLILTIVALGMSVASAAVFGVIAGRIKKFDRKWVWTVETDGQCHKVSRRLIHDRMDLREGKQVRIRILNSKDLQPCS